MALRNNRLGWMIILSMLSASLSAQTADTAAGPRKHELTVKEAVDLAYKNVIELKNATLDYRIQAAKNREILGQALPQVTGTIGSQYYLQLPKLLFPQSDQNVYDVLKREGLLPPSAQAPPATLVQFSFQQPWNFMAGATLTQLLFQPDVFVGLRARQTALDYNTALIGQAKERIKDSAYKHYYAILIAEKQLHFLNESVTRLEKLYHDDSILYKNGFAEHLDLDKVTVQLNNLRTSQSLIQSGVTLSYASLKYSLGLSQRDTIVLKEDLSDQSLKEGILDQGFRYEDRAEIRTLNYVKGLQSLDVKRYKLSSLPTVALAGNYTLNGMGQHFFTNSSTIWLRSSYIGLNVNVPIYNGLQRKYRVQQAELTLEKVGNTIDNVKQGIDLEQVATKESLKTALFNLDVQQRNVELAEKVYNATKTKFEQGVGSSFEVLQADTDFQMAQSNYFNALYSATIAKISYLYSLGRL
ncbi:MAG TPA: TolC family protein [Chitinophagaceae bacterium]